MRLLRIGTGLLIAAAMMAMIAGCEKEGPAEKAGKQIDQAVQKAGDEAGKAANAAGKKLKEAGDKIQEGASKQ